MAKSENKTKPEKTSPAEFISKVSDEKKRRESFELLEMMHKATGQPPVMWGPSIIGFGSYHYKYDTGREGDAPAAGFSPRKDALSVYIMAGFPRNAELMEKLGKYKTGVSCLYIKTLDDIDRKVLAELIKKSYKYITAKKWP